jgi:hypothetical protein
MDEAKINASLHLAIEVIRGNQIFQRNGNVFPEVPGLVTKHDAPPVWLDLCIQGLLVYPILCPSPLALKNSN